MGKTILEVTDVTIQYDTPGEAVTAVSDATLELEDGEYFGLIGESGCGKSTLAKAILKGLDPTLRGRDERADPMEGSCVDSTVIDE